MARSPLIGRKEIDSQVENSEPVTQQVKQVKTQGFGLTDGQKSGEPCWFGFLRITPLLPSVPLSLLFFHSFFCFYIPTAVFPPSSVPPTSPAPCTPPSLFRKPPAFHGYQPATVYQVAAKLGISSPIKLDEATWKEERVPRVGNRIRGSPRPHC